MLLCSKYREGKKVKTKTVANLSHFPENVILVLRTKYEYELENIKMCELKIGRGLTSIHYPELYY